MMRIDYKDFNSVKLSVLLLATFGVIITTLVVGFINVFYTSAISNCICIFCFDFTYRCCNRDKDI